jgi:formate hydrogenlyase subunit 4
MFCAATLLNYLFLVAWFMFAGQLSIVLILVEDCLVLMLWAVFAAVVASLRCARAARAKQSGACAIRW